MADVRITLTDAQVAEVIFLDPRKTVEQIVQTHVDTWLAPLVAKSAQAERVSIAAAYAVADASVQQSVREALKVDTNTIKVASGRAIG